jgi:threonine/homoserine/homoserine lactone efflux protein
MFLWSAIVGGLMLGLFMALSVGPTLFAIIKYSLNHSYKTGLAFVLGVSISDIIFVTIANFAAPLLNFIYTYEKLVAISGGMLLILIGIVSFFKKYKPVRPSTVILKIKKGHYFKIFASGFLINTANPGVILNWIAAATLVANATNDLSDTKSILYKIVFFGICLFIVLGIDVLKVILADSIRKKLTLRKIMYLQKISAICLLLIGVGLIVVTLFTNLLSNETATLTLLNKQ